ncbi:hypothetical protein K3495_g659 [Podosphaera aphanis]|nr:hypothetical protein K3495_g659 [Podosphaera aphanis]
MSAGLHDKQRFATSFYQEHSNLHDEITRLEGSCQVDGTRQTALEDILARLTRLSHAVSDANEHHNAYDQRAYSQAIKDLEEMLAETQGKLTPKSKFRFKTKPRSNYVPHINEPLGMSQRHIQNSSETKGKTGSCGKVSAGAFDGHSLCINNESDGYLQVAEESSKPSNATATHVEISNYENQHVTPPPSISCGSSFGSITRLRRCVVDTSSLTLKDPYGGLAIADVKSSLIIAGQVAGAAHITGVHESVIVVIARQVRLHDCTDVKIYLHCSSRPIIENCINIQFSSLPKLFITTAQELERNQWDQVDDFKWLKSTPSPNWSTLPEDKRLDESIWNEIQSESDFDIANLLKKIGVKEL